MYSQDFFVGSVLISVLCSSAVGAKICWRLVLSVCLTAYAFNVVYFCSFFLILLPEMVNKDEKYASCSQFLNSFF